MDTEDPRVWTSNGQDGSFPPSQQAFSLSSQAASGTGRILAQSEPYLVNIPNYIKPFPPSLELEDIQYLEKKGVLTLPDADLRDACLRCYFQHVHPMYPIVDPGEIVSLLKETDARNGQLSLLLLYALIFVGGTWIDVRLVRKLGFLSRRAFRKSIHKKMRLLYDVDYETDRLCLIQVFILWTFWFEGPNENKDGWHWIGVALSLSRVIGLHQCPSDVDTNSSLNRLRRRLWWCLVTRDVICSFALSRCPRIADINTNITMLGIEDFDFDPMPHMLQESSSQTLCQQQTLAQICVLYFKLVSIFGMICKTAYPESGSGKTSVLYSSQQLEGMDSISSDKNLSMTDQLKIFQHRLDEWRQDVPDDLWHNSNLLSNINGPEKVEHVQRGLLSMMYYATVMILHRPQVLAMSTVTYSLDTSQSATPDSSRVMVGFAARQMTQIAMDFYQEDLIESLAATCISCLILASISHIFDMISSEPVVRSEAHKKLEQCKAIFQAFSEQQAGGQWALEVIDYIMFRLKHQPGHSKADLTTSRVPTNSKIVKQSDFSFPSGHLSGADKLQTHHFLDSTDLSRKQATGAPGTNVVPMTSGMPSVPVFPLPRQSFSFNESLLPGLTLDQPLPDNLMSFLGPDLAWLDFPNASENLDGMSWTGGM